MRRAVHALALSLALALAGACRCEAEDFIAYYSGTWAGLPGADIRVEFSDAGDRYRNHVIIQTKGLPRWFTHFRFDGIGEGKILGDGGVMPSRFDVDYDVDNRRNARISLNFSAQSGAQVAERTPADSNRKPPLPEIYRRNVIDPISAVWLIRERLRKATDRRGMTFDLPAFDGARRFQVTGGVVSAGGPDHLVEVALTLIPVAGFHGEATDDPNPDDTPRPVQVTLTDDARLLPVQLRVPVVYFPFVARFGHLCASFDTCNQDEN
jgi:hypothetical protein